MTTRLTKNIVVNSLFPVSVFNIKEYKLPIRGKKRMPVCQEWTRGSLHGQTLMHTTFVNMAFRINMCVSMVGAQRSSKAGLVTKPMNFTMKKTKRNDQCKTCLVCFTYESQLLRHEDTHKDSKLPYKCPSKSCKKFTDYFKSQQALNHHMDIHRGVQIPCTVAGCPKTFPTKSYLKEHLNTKHGPGYNVRTLLMDALSNAGLGRC